MAREVLLSTKMGRASLPTFASCTERKLNLPLTFVSKSLSKICNVLLSGGNVTYVYIKVAMPVLRLGKLYSFRIIIAKDEREKIKDWTRLLPEMRRTAIYIASRGNNTLAISTVFVYSYLPRAIIPCDKCNLHIICRVPIQRPFTVCHRLRSVSRGSDTRSFY